MKSKDEILEELRNILAQVIEIDINDIVIKESSRLINGIDVEEYDLNLSSIDYVEYLVSIEEHFNIVFDFDKRMETVCDLVEYINCKLKAGEEDAE